MRVRVCVCVYAARAPVRLSAWLRASIVCVSLLLRGCMPASDYALVFTNRSTVPFTRPDFPFCSIFDSCTPFLPPFHDTLPPPALVVTPSLSLPPSPSLCLSLVYSSLSPSARFFEPNYPDFVSSDPTIN